MMRPGVFAACAVAAYLALASVVGADWSEKGKKLLDALVIVECVMGADTMTGYQRAILDKARKEGALRPYSEGWCIEQGIVPSALMDGGRES
jgi:hypothetical protein